MGALIVCLVVALPLVIAIGLIVAALAPYVLDDAEDSVFGRSPRLAYAYTPLPEFTCAVCGDGPWAGEWSPLAPADRKMCPNCSGAD